MPSSRRTLRIWLAWSCLAASGPVSTSPLAARADTTTWNTNSNGFFGVDKLVVGSLTVSLARLFVADLAMLNAATSEAGRGFVVGEIGSDDAPALTIGDAAGAVGALNINSNVVTITGNLPSDLEVIVGNRGAGALNVTGSPRLGHVGALTDPVLANRDTSPGAVTVSGGSAEWTLGDIVARGPFLRLDRLPCPNCLLNRFWSQVS